MLSLGEQSLAQGVKVVTPQLWHWCHHLHSLSCVPALNKQTFREVITNNESTVWVGASKLLPSFMCLLSPSTVQREGMKIVTSQLDLVSQPLCMPLFNEQSAREGVRLVKP